MNALKTRRALFVEGKEADFEEFVLLCGEVYRPGFKAATRGITVFETGGATKQWPFDAIDGFQQLLGTDLKYLYVSDRDFLTDPEIQQRVDNASATGRSIAHLERRHRESYLAVPTVLARVLEKKWKTKHENESIPTEFTAESLHVAIVRKAADLQEAIRAELLVQHESGLKGPSDHRQTETIKLNQYFHDAYTAPLNRGDIPYKLLDCKRILKELRANIAQTHRISFSDKDIIACFTRQDIPNDLAQVIDRILGMFPAIPEVRTAVTEPTLFELHVGE